MSMAITAVKKYPQISDQAGSTVSFALCHDNTAFAVYEGQRDFLSTPKPFVVLKVRFDAEPLICSGGQLLSAAQWEDLQKKDYGLYLVSESELCQSTNESHWVCYSPELTLEFCAIDVAVEKTLYHQASVFTALTYIINQF